MNKLVSKKKATTASALVFKNRQQRKLYCKLKNIDTIIMDRGIFFDINNIYGYNKYLKKLLIDLNNPSHSVNVDLNSETTIENISFLNYPMLDGITIPLETLDAKLGYCIFVTPSRTNIKKINILYNDKVNEIDLDENISWYRIDKELVNDEYVLTIKIGYNNDVKKIITYDKLGNKTIFYKNKVIENNKVIDLRKHIDSVSITYIDKLEPIDTFIITPEILKKIKLQAFKNLCINKFLILSDSNMKLNPNILEVEDVELSIYSNKIYLKDKNNEEMYVYLDDNEELKIIKKEIDKEYKFQCTDITSGVIIKHKNHLKFDLIINNKKFHINKIFINWYLNNKSNYDKKIIPYGYNLDDGYMNIFDYNENDLKVISDYIFDTLLEEIITHGLFENFDNQYKCYLKYLKHLENLRKKGFSYKALIYLHKNGYDNITGIKNKYRNIEDKELINTFNELGKKLIKRRNRNESK